MYVFRSWEGIPCYVLLCFSQANRSCLFKSILTVRNALFVKFTGNLISLTKPKLILRYYFWNGCNHVSCLLENCEMILQNQCWYLSNLCVRNCVGNELPLNIKYLFEANDSGVMRHISVPLKRIPTNSISTVYYSKERTIQLVRPLFQRQICFCKIL